MRVPSGAMALGVPAKLRLDTVDPTEIMHIAELYVANGERYRNELRRVD
jgi:hypothetical protein